MVAEPEVRETPRPVADVVTLSRVPIAVGMVLLRRHRCVTASLFAAGVATDLVDGPLARRFGTDSARGARLDGAADAVFVAASAFVAASTVDPSARRLVGSSAGLVTATRLATLVVTRTRFATWSIMHTHLNKASGLCLAVVGGVALLRGRMPLAALAAVAALAEAAALEELVIVCTTSEHDPDRRSLLAVTAR